MGVTGRGHAGHTVDTPTLVAWKEASAGMGANAGRKKTIMTRGLIGRVGEGLVGLAPWAQYITYVCSSSFGAPIREDAVAASRPSSARGSDNEAPQLTDGQPWPQNSRVTPDISRPSPALIRPKVGPRRAAGAANSRDTHFSRAKRGPEGARCETDGGFGASRPLARSHSGPLWPQGFPPDRGGWALEDPAGAR